MINDKRKKKDFKLKSNKSDSILTTLILFASFGILLGGGIVSYLNPKVETKTETININEEPKVLSAKNSTEILAPDDTIKDSEKEIIAREPLPQTSAKAFGIYFKDDMKSQDFVELNSYNKDQILPFGSIAKVMTALVAIDNFPLDKRIEILPKCEGIKDASNVGFKAGEIFTLQDILYGLIVKSGADAACTIANIGGDEPAFIKDMNRKASELNMHDTKFQNSIGFDAGATQVSSIKDLKILSEQALKNNVLRKIMGTQMIEITSKNSMKKYKFESTNDLLKSIPGTIGIKTGSTSGAGECLSYLYSDGKKEILIVLLGSNYRFEDTRLLLGWAKRSALQDNSQ